MSAPHLEFGMIDLFAITVIMVAFILEFIPSEIWSRRFYRQQSKILNRELTNIKKQPPIESKFYKINGWGYDWCMIFDVKDSNQDMSDEEKKYSMKKIVRALREIWIVAKCIIDVLYLLYYWSVGIQLKWNEEKANLEVKLFFSAKRDTAYCKIRCDAEDLENQVNSDIGIINHFRWQNIYIHARLYLEHFFPSNAIWY